MNFNKILKSLFGDKSSRDMKPPPADEGVAKAGTRFCKCPEGSYR